MIQQIALGKTSWKYNMDRQSRELIGEPVVSVDFKDSVFYTPESGTKIDRNLVAIIAGGFGLEHPRANVLGLLQPNPALPFAPEWLPHIPLAKTTVDKNAGKVSLEWVEYDKAGALLS